MTLLDDKALREAILKLTPQTHCEFGCDGDGTYSDTDMNGEQVPAQYEYCYVVRFPIVDSLVALVKEQQQTWADHIIGDNDFTYHDLKNEGSTSISAIPNKIRNELRTEQRKHNNIGKGE